MAHNLLMYESDSEPSYQFYQSSSDGVGFQINQIKQFYPEIENIQQNFSKLNIFTMGEQLWSWQSYIDNKFATDKRHLKQSNKYNFEIKKCKIIEVLFQLSIINKKCLIGQFFLNFETGIIGYFINTLLYQNQSLDILEFDKISLNIFQEDLTNFQKYFKNFREIDNNSDHNFQLLKQVEYSEVQAKEIKPFIDCYQINIIIIYQKDKQTITFALQNFDGNIIKSNLYIQNLEYRDIQNLQKLHYNFSFPNSQNLYSSNKYLQSYFIYKNEVYCLYPQFQTLKQYMKVKDKFLSFKSRILILHKIYLAVNFLHQIDIFHTYINLESIFILRNSILYLGYLEKAYTLMIDRDQYKYQNHRIYTPLELRKLLDTEERGDMILPCRKTDIYQLGILSLQFLFQIDDNQLSNIQEIKKQILIKTPYTFSHQYIELLLQCIDDNVLNRPLINQLLAAANELEYQFFKI